MTRYRYVTCDVFTGRPFCGNPLAVLPDARGLTEAQMQSIAREFNYSETTFVLPPDDPRHAARVRIFTPGGELPFAGHPTIGTAFVLASTGTLPREAAEIVFEEGVGPVPVAIFRDGDRVTHCRLTAARLPEQGPPAPAANALAKMLSLAEGEVLAGAACWSCGVPFLVVPVAGLGALARCALELPVWRELLAAYPTQKVYPVARIDDLHWRVRMFAPGLGVAEDPATGSAAASFAGWLAQRLPQPRDGTLAVRLEQGVEMGRPAELHLEFDRSAGSVTAVRVGGAAVMVAEGTLSVPA
jgi:trans-2,3-dihydro-3-hydroxyanthranilate isomerase